MDYYTRLPRKTETQAGRFVVFGFRPTHARTRQVQYRKSVFVGGEERNVREGEGWREEGERKRQRFAESCDGYEVHRADLYKDISGL